ncbi:uberolysin/carnocyclin family circular bacteriocin [Bacillus sp. FJAT-45037]|uniref:uberolysin/carnocyclin family circular bacteriocin n=1 Tax=Bacillus sp. FJAT-45037 TaxID=2011007 RepID=UPI000C24048F|nr:uberolysin/carnocyclin family circular bacteriocin [Bacillus sp. FJAT-45037]
MKHLSKAVLLVVTVSLGIMLLIGSLNFSPTKTQATSSNVNTSVEYKEVGLKLAQQINKHSKKTWNQSQTQASKIVNLVMNGSDVYTAVTAVIGVFTFGWGFAIISAAQLSLKWYIKKKGRKAAVTW